MLFGIVCLFWGREEDEKILSSQYFLLSGNFPPGRLAPPPLHVITPKTRHSIFAVMCRKKAKISKSSATVTEVLHSSSNDKHEKPAESDIPDEESNNDPSVSHCQPMLLSQSGKFIPKFMAKKKMRDCVVKLDSTCKLVDSENFTARVSEIEVGMKSLPFDSGPAADEVVDNDCSAQVADSVAVTDDGNDDNEPTVAESEVAMIANEPDAAASDYEHARSLNNHVAESIGSAKQELSDDTALQLEDMLVTDHSKDNDRGRLVIAEEKESGTNDEVLGESEQYINSTDTDQCDVRDSTKQLSSQSVNINSKAAEAHTSATETASDANEDSEEPKALEISSHEDSLCPADTDVAMDGSKTASTDYTTTDIVLNEVNAIDALDHTSPEAVTKILEDVLPVRDHVEVDADAVLCSDDDGPKVAMHGSVEDTSSITMATSDSKTDTSTVSSEIYVNSKADVDQTVTMPVISASAGGGPDEETGDDNVVREPGELIPESAELPSFDDFLDLTDSQLCQLDDVSR